MLPLVDSVIVLCSVVRYFVSIISMGRESWLFCFVFLMSRDGLSMPRVCLQIVIVVFPDNTHLLFSYNILDFFIFQYFS